MKWGSFGNMLRWHYIIGRVEGSDTRVGRVACQTRVNTRVEIISCRVVQLWRQTLRVCACKMHV